MTKQKRTIFYSLIILLMVLLLSGFGFLYREAQLFVADYISKKIQSEIIKTGKREQLAWETISVSFIPLRAKIKEVTVHAPKNTLFPHPLKIDTLIVEPDYMGLFQKALTAKITLIRANITIKTQIQKEEGSNYIKKYFSMDFLEKIPVSNLRIKETSIHLITNTHNILTKKLNTHIRLHPSKITIKADMPFMEIGSHPVFSSSIDITIKPDMIQIAHFKIKNENSWLNITSSAKGDIESYNIQSGRMKVNGSFFSEDLTIIAQIINPDFYNPFKGKVTLESELYYNKISRLSGYIDLSAEQFYAQNIFLSKVQMRGTIKNQIVSLNRFHINNPNKWDINFNDSKIYLKKPYSFQTEVVIKNSQLEAFFKAFKLNNIPITSTTNGKWKCNGVFLSKQAFKCEGTAHLNRFIVYGGKNQIVLDIPKLKVSSLVNFDNKIFTNYTVAQIGSHSEINIEGILDEKNKFVSQYKGVVHLSDIGDLVKLKPQGIINITDGSITTFNKKLNIQSDLNIENLVISQFHMGNVSTKLQYTEKGLLSFRKIKAQIKKSQYKGNLNINILKNTIQLFAHFPYITLEDLKYGLKDRVYFPFDITGSGTLSAYLNGPLKINALSYNLQAQLFKINWEKEIFEKAIVQLESEDGHVKTKQVELLKNNGKVLFQGQVNPKGNMTAKMTGIGLHLQESENISRITGPETTGVMDFDLNLEGYFLNPLTTATVLIRNSFYKGYPIKNSNINLKLRRHQVEAKGSIADKLNIQNLIFPYKKDGLIQLQATTNNFNIKELFLSQGESTQLYNQFRSSINSIIDLSYQKNQFSRSATGNITVQNMAINANAYTLVNKSPFTVKLKKGFIHTDPILLQSGEHFLNITQSQTKQKDIFLNGNIKLDFFIFIFPFMKTWEGDLTADLTLNPQLSQLSPKGQIQLNNGFIQLHSNIETFEEIYSDMKVDNHKLSFQSFYTKIGGGTLQATGNIHFLNKDGYTPVDIKGSFNEVQFGTLQGIYTKGSGQIFLIGKTFPYTLGITADIEKSRIEKEFVSNQSDQVQVSPRIALLEEDTENFEPIQMRFNFYLKDPVQIENSTMKSSFSGKIKVTGYPSHPLLYGKLTALPGGTIIFRDHEFDILSSQITYSNDKPSNPLINLRAKTFIQEETDVNDFSGTLEETNINDFRNDFDNEYSIILRVKGRGSTPVFQLTSTPAMTEKQIVSLLTFGVRSIRFEPGSTINNIAKYSYYHLGPALFQKAIGRELKNTLGVDQFLIVPHISSKTNSTATKLIVRKKMFNRLNLSASQTILDNYPESDVKAEYKINKNISIIGLWQNEDPVEGSDLETNTIGLDLEYQIDF